VPEAISAAELAAGYSLRPRHPLDHREDRPGLADPSPPSEPRKEPPFAGVDRRSPASARPEEEGGAGDWSNLTSGPKGPTVSDPEPARAGLSGGVIPEVRLLRPENAFSPNRFSFSVLIKNRF
jgi:hypothetical protein